MSLAFSSFLNSFFAPRDGSAADKYCYRALTDSKDIRLRVSAKWFGGYRYAIVQTPLSKAPIFQTVSYVWGTATRYQCLTLENEGSLAITDSLAKAIPRLSKYCTTAYLWVDQIFMIDA